MTMTDAPIDDGGPAFPVHWNHAAPDAGMALRDYFAGLAMQGQLPVGDEFTADTARAAYRMADAMLAERKKGPSA